MIAATPASHLEPKELIRFIRANHWLVAWPEELLERFFTDLSSSPDYRMDFFRGQERVAVAVLLDRVENSLNDGNLEVLAIAPGVDPETIYDRVIPIAQAQLPKTRSGFSLGFPAKLEFVDALAARHGLVPNYDMFEMLRRAARVGSTLSNPVFPPGVQIEFIDPSTTIHDPELYAVLRESFRENPDTSIPAFSDWVAGRQRTRELRTWLLRQEGKIIGFLNLYLRSAGGEVSTIGVLPAARRQGLGRALLSQALVYLEEKGVQQCQLSVATHNRRALGLYEDLGFQVIDQHRAFRWARPSH